MAKRRVSRWNRNSVRCRRMQQSCVHYGYTGQREAARRLYQSGLVPFAKYWNAFSTGLAHAKAGKPCPCEDCNK